MERLLGFTFQCSQHIKDRFRTRSQLDFGKVWAPFWEVFRSQERKSGVPERFEKAEEKEGDKKSCQ